MDYYDPYATDVHELDDTALLTRARCIHECLMRLPQRAPGRDDLIHSWRRCIDEANHRALPEDDYIPPETNK
jgi:hypothetical protein